jgi:predicted  nucleic acid-binding Zn-ribbon protein
VRATSQSVIDREHNVLSQRAVQLESEVAYLRQQLTAATRAAEDASRQLHLQQTTYTADTSALRSELKLSAYSVSTITANYEVVLEYMHIHIYTYAYLSPITMCMYRSVACSCRGSPRTLSTAERK